MLKNLLRHWSFNEFAQHQTQEIGAGDESKGGGIRFAMDERIRRRQAVGLERAFKRPIGAWPVEDQPVGLSQLLER